MERLNDAQMTILQLFQHRKMTKTQLIALKDALVNHLANELDLEVNKVMKKKGVTAKKIEQKTNAINTHRGNYLKAVRDKLHD
ncbi:MAG: hypothetical protein U0Y10_26875 [Spirosomataceae bacterium]